MFTDFNVDKVTILQTYLKKNKFDFENTNFFLIFPKERNQRISELPTY